MWIDPIVEEVRAIRRELAAEAGHDLDRICEELRRRDALMPERIRIPRKARPALERLKSRQDEGPVSETA